MKFRVMGIVSSMSLNLDMLGLYETKFRGTKDMNFGEVRVFKSRLGWRERTKKVWY